MSKVNMPYKRENDYNKSQGQGGTKVASTKLYSPLPEKAGAKEKNAIMIPVCYPPRWNLFNPAAHESAKYNMLSATPGSPLSIPADLSSFYFKIPVHGVANFNRPDGSVGFSQTVCPVQLNKYLTEVLQFGPLFNQGVRCAFCEEADKYWNEFNARWKELGYDDAAKKALSRDKYREISENDATLKHVRNMARKYKSTDRYVLPIIDYDQLAGVRPLKEGQVVVEHQVWFAPNSVFESLADFCEMSQEGQEFYNFDNPQGAQVIYIVKDTTRCSPANLVQTQYSVVQGPRIALDSNWLAYIANPENMTDPSEFLHLVSYDEQRFYLGAGGAPGTPPVAKSPPMAAPSTTPQAAPQPAPMPQAAAAPVPVASASGVPQMPSPVPSPIPDRPPVANSPVPVIPQAQGLPNRTPPGPPPGGKRVW